MIASRRGRKRIALRRSSFEDVIVHEDPETVAGVLVEPIGNTGGIITPTEEYFRNSPRHLRSLRRPADF